MRTDMLYVAWQASETRRIMPVGRLVRSGALYEFAYIRAAHAAQAHGFEPLLSFPSLHSVYRSRFLPPLFSNRVMNPSREEYGPYVAAFGLSLDQAEPFTVLARSGGRRSTDKLEIFAPPRQSPSGTEGLFLARGVRHVAESEAIIRGLSPGERLCVVQDRENPVNPLALVLADMAGQRFAYVPDYLANEMGRVGVDPGSVVLSVERINPDPVPVHHRMLCKFYFPAGLGSELFTGDDYRPISSDASNVAA